MTSYISLLKQGSMVTLMKENKPEGVLRAVKGEKHEAVYWEDGGMDVKIDGRWHTRFDNSRYVESSKLRSRFLDGINKEDITVEKRVEP